MDTPPIPRPNASAAEPRWNDDCPYHTLVLVPGELVSRDDVAMWLLDLADDRASLTTDGRRPRMTFVVSAEGMVSGAIGRAELVPDPRGPAGYPIQNVGEVSLAYAVLLRAKQTLNTSLQTVRARREPKEGAAIVDLALPVIGIQPANGRLGLRALILGGNQYVEATRDGYDEAFVLTPEANEAAQRDRFAWRASVVPFPDAPPA